LLNLYLTKSFDFGEVQISVNGDVMKKRTDLYAAQPMVEKVSLGTSVPQDGAYLIRLTLIGKNPASKGSGTMFGIDAMTLTPEVKITGPAK